MYLLPCNVSLLLLIIKIIIPLANMLLCLFVYLGCLCLLCDSEGVGNVDILVLQRKLADVIVVRFEEPILVSSGQYLLVAVCHQRRTVEMLVSRRRSGQRGMPA